MNTGAAHGLLDGSKTPNFNQESICLSTTSLFAGERGIGGTATGLAFGSIGISTSSG